VSSREDTDEEKGADGHIFAKKLALEKEACNSGRLVDFLMTGFEQRMMPQVRYETPESLWHVQFFFHYLKLVLQPWQHRSKGYFKPSMYIFPPDFLTSLVANGFHAEMEDASPCLEKLFSYNFWVLPFQLDRDQWSFSVVCYPYDKERIVIIGFSSTAHILVPRLCALKTEDEKYSVQFNYTKTTLYSLQDQCLKERAKLGKPKIRFLPDRSLNIEVIKIPVPRQQRKSDCLFFLFYFLKVLSCTRLFETNPWYKESVSSWPADLVPQINAERRIFELMIDGLMQAGTVPNSSVPVPPAELCAQLETLYSTVENHNSAITLKHVTPPQFQLVSRKDKSGFSDCCLSNNTELPPRKKIMISPSEDKHD